MNKKFLTPILVLSLMAVGFTGCMDDNTSALPEGTEFNFGAAVEFNRTRTYYDPGDVATPGATSWKIFWNYKDPLDHIYVYSRQGATGCNQASYTVNATEENMSEPAPVTKDGSTGVQLGTASSYDFYAMYPASAVTAGSGRGTTLSATMPINQTASTTEKMTTEPVGELQTAADMNCALMIATKKGHTATTEKVSLEFEPFATMLDITVNGIDNNTNSKVRITSVIIEADKDVPIAGDFTYDYENKSFAFGANKSNSISIETMFADADGNKVGVMMGNGSTLKVRAFMIPNPAVTSLKVKVVTAQSQTMTRTLNMSNFEAKQIHFVKLPKIDVDNLKFDYSIWLSQLDPDIYISEISLPGSALSFNYVMSDGDVKKTQTLNVTEQFNAGVRVFQCHVNIINQTSLLDDEPTSVGIADSEGNEIPKNDGTGYWTIGDMLKVLREEMAGIHKDEFCVLAISDWIKDVTPNKVKDLYSRLKVVLDAAGREGAVATGISPNTTIDDIKGKIIIKVQLNGDYSDAWRELTGSNVWMNIFKSEAETSVFYSPMPFATFPNPNDGGSLTGTMNYIYSDCAEPLKDNNRWYNVRDNATAVLAAYANNYSSIEHNNFSMTYLGGCGGAYGYYPSDVANELNSLWLTNKNRPEKKPWGWVMFNCVGTEPTTTQGIQAVIEHNASPDFTLARRSAAKTQPSGDTQGTANGGSIFY